MHYNNEEKELISKLNKINSFNLNKYLNIFENLYQTCCLRKTAKNINISLGSVSQTIKKLEKALMTSLFKRKGKNGMEPTEEAKILHTYAKQLILTINSIGENFNIKVLDERISIVCHILAPKKYVFPAIKNMDTKTNFKINVGDRDECIKQLLSGKADIMVYPLEAQQIANLQSNFIIKETKPYNMCLFLNKQHTLAKKSEKEIDWNALKHLNIAPSTQRTRVDTYARILTNMDQGEIITETSELFLLYEGLCNNSWCLGFGEEFKEYFDCKDISIKNSNKNTNVKAYLKWCICYNKKQQKLEKIAKLIEQCFEKKKTKTQEL